MKLLFQRRGSLLACHVEDIVELIVGIKSWVREEQQTVADGPSASAPQETRDSHAVLLNSFKVPGIIFLLSSR